MTNINCKIVPLTSTNMTPIANEANGFMLWHLHVNNISASPVTVEIHLGDATTPGINTLMLVVNVPPYASENPPMSLSNVSFPAGTVLSAKATVADVANVVINTEVR